MTATTPPKSGATDDGIERLYEGLSRYQWWRRRLGRPQAGDSLEMHKRLAAAGADRPAGGTAGLNAWLADRLAPLDGARILDVGCGFGATLFHFVRSGAVGGTGVTLSAYQARRATEQARAIDLHSSVRFATQRIEDPIKSTETPFDIAVSIETLLHVPDLGRALECIASATRGSTRGQIAIVEDMSVTAELGPSNKDPIAATLLERWSTARLHTAEDYRAALDTGGFDLTDEVDLSDQVVARPEPVLAKNERRLLRARRLVPTGRRVIDAFLGGIALERLYASKRIRYVAMFAKHRGARG